MHMILDADRLSPTQVAQRLHVHVGTVWRWMTRGVRARVLPSIMYGGRRFILIADLEKFLAAGRAGRSIAIATAPQRADQAAKLLDAAGVKRC